MILADYQQLPGGPDADTYAGRLAACAGCRHRVAATCRPLAQLFTVAARLPGARCPAGLWPDQPAGKLATPPAASSSAHRASVVVICHNQGRFLQDAVESIQRQTTPPAEIWVIDCASTDETPSLIRELMVSPELTTPVRTFHAETSNLAEARYLAFRLTAAEFLVTLDADDRLGPTYLADGIAALDRDQSAAIAWTDLTQFGDRVGAMGLQAGDIHRQNWIHSGSIVRRAALDQLEPAQAWPENWNRIAHHDWRLWRSVLANGWTAVKSPARYHYRRHADSLTAEIDRTKTPWSTLADLYHEPLTLFVAASGRDQLLTRLPWLLGETRGNHGGPLSLVVAVTTSDPMFLRNLHTVAANALETGHLQSLKIYRQTVGADALPDADRHQPLTRRAVQIAMSRIYSRAWRETTDEYLWILEDDVGPPADALPAMLAGFADRVASVALPYRSRYQSAYVAWTPEGTPYTTPPATGLSPVGGNGFGCVVLRRSWFQSIPIRSDRSGDYDPEFYADLRRCGGVAMLDWSRPCTHGEPHAADQ